MSKGGSKIGGALSDLIGAGGNIQVPGKGSKPGFDVSDVADVGGSVKPPRYGSSGDSIELPPKGKDAVGATDKTDNSRYLAGGLGVVGLGSGIAAVATAVSTSVASVAGADAVDKITNTINEALKLLSDPYVLGSIVGVTALIVIGPAVFRK
jgi:hypothetical protein